MSFRGSYFADHISRIIVLTHAMNSYLERLRREIDDAIGGATADAMAQAPDGKWSAAQILEHLFLTYKHTNRGLAKCLEKGAPLATRPTLKDRFAKLVVLTFGHIPTGRNAPERTMPRGLLPGDAQSSLAVELTKMEIGFDDCERRFGAGTKLLDHPFMGPLTANEWRKFHWVHARHHARQIRERLAGH